MRLLSILIIWSISLSTWAKIPTESTTLHPTIPVVDLNDYYSPDDHNVFIDTMRTALREVGFFAVKNPNIKQETLTRAYDAIEGYFKQDLSLKMKDNDPNLNGQRGYVPSESAKGHGELDFKEFYHVGRPLDPRKAFHLGYADNVWPEHYDLEAPLTQLYHDLGAHVEVIAEAIDQPKDLFTSKIQDGDTLLRALHYPANAPDGRLWAAEHTDIDLFTILPRSTAKGLQVKNKHGKWVDVIVPEDAFIVNGGDMLENMTNGEFKSSMHRVVDKGEGKERFSIVYFVHAKPNDDLSPTLKSIQRTGGVQRYANATEAELLSERLLELGLASRDRMKFLADSGVMERLIQVNRASPEAMIKLKEAGLASAEVKDALDKINHSS